ncbi:MAG: tRNA 2-thiouridine(34) synthase MnmA, partial [Candidatus Goldiibacteriota bacterium]
QAAYRLGIKHYTLNMKKDFKKKVVDYFISDYINGRTPNPCVICNEEVKFRALLHKMKEHGFDGVATGHYARIGKNGGDYFLKEALDKSKSQEYFLSRLKPEELKKIVFPLGGMKKINIKAMAKSKGLYVEKPESQEVCFLRRNETPYEFIKRSMDISLMNKGGFYTTEGGKIADITDSAYFNFTLGQRRGLGLSAGRPVHVVKIDAENKRVIVGGKKEVFSRRFFVSKLNIYLPQKKIEFAALVKVRYRQKKSAAQVRIGNSGAEITFKEAQFAVTPGQLAVIYKNDSVIGSGFIEAGVNN